MIIVQKYGGSSVSDNEKLYKVANIDDYNKTSNRALIFYQYSGGSYE